MDVASIIATLWSKSSGSVKIRIRIGSVKDEVPSRYYTLTRYGNVVLMIRWISHCSTTVEIRMSEKLTSTAPVPSVVFPGSTKAASRHVFAAEWPMREIWEAIVRLSARFGAANQIS